VTDANDTQYVVAFLILGMALGQTIYGPLSDAVGRKPAIYAGLALFAAGTAVSLAAQDFPTMLAGRVMQGLGAAGPRIVVMALVRDQFAGAAMARIMSIVITVFLLVPIVAPFLGQGVLMIAHWRALFVLMLALALGVLAWFALRQPETLPRDRRRPFALAPIAGGIKETLATRAAFGHMLASGFILGAVFAYVNSARQIFQDQYEVGASFPLYFAGLALAVGVATMSNAKLVTRFDMRALCRWAVRVMLVLSLAFFAVCYPLAGHPPLWGLMLYLALTFFCMGILFGNLNALAMEPLGHIAGIASSVIGTITMLVGFSLSTAIGQSYDGTLLPIVAGFAVLGLAALAALAWAHRAPATPDLPN
jgi:DHA1 family bicyclomycin/chloramphenicol resistance-like MFS transporter